ncbi:MAG: DUF4142 domain-containing protein [Thermoanaerobaculia bacterium]|nr:DUF4142 domain-containing protein [Thermoanaerobaculia bacterium]
MSFFSTSVFAEESAKINDAQIASIVVTANQVDIDAGKVAVANAVSRSVSEFGTLMANDHMGVNQAAIELVTRLGVTPEDNATSQSLAAGGQENLDRLGKLEGHEFDLAYMQHEVQYHQQVLNALDDVLIPGAENAELKALLIKVRPAFVAHLDRAQQIVDELE